MIKILDLVGRIFISGIFLLSGFNKIGNYDGTVGWMESFGLPGFLLIPAIVLEILAPILIIIGYQTRIAAGALSLFCIATAVIFHNDFSDQMQIIAFMKNIALAGGFLFLVVNGAKGYSLDRN
jgi:putative oxidoreductase|tara:strand:- start:250 stop:618 length:369 start_codon:yes stop_codon:yes gene_type:complete